MRGFFAIVVRELNDRRAVFAAAAFAALMPILVPFAPGIGWSSAADVREMVAICMALGLGWILALVLGAGMIGSDLVQGRLGFYFSRPVNGGSIWWGKVVANLLLVFVTELIILLPIFLFFDANPVFDFHSMDWWVTVGLMTGGPLTVMFGMLIVIPLLLILASHAIGIMWRARSLWIALDAAVFVSLVAILWIRLVPLAFEAPIAVMFIGGAVLLSVSVALFLAGWTQVSLGRTDPQRGHRMLSLVLWGFLCLVVTGAVGYGAWFTAVEPSDLVGVDAVQVAPTGPWIEVVGKLERRFEFMPRFLFNRETGAFLRIPSAKWWSDRVDFSLNGERAVWLAQSGSDLSQLVYADLGDERPAVIETPLTFAETGRWIVSEDGQRLAIIGGETLSFHEIETGALLLAAQRKDWRWPLMAWFVSDDIFRIVSRPGTIDEGVQIIEIFEYDLASGTVVTTGKVEANGEVAFRGGKMDWDVWTNFDPGRDRFLLSEGSELKYLTIRSARTGEVELDLGVRPRWSVERWTDDGRLVRAYAEEEQRWLEVISIEEGTSKRWPLGNALSMELGGESRPGEVSIGLRMESEGDWEWDYLPISINIDTGVIRHPEGVLEPVRLPWNGSAEAGASGCLWWGRPAGANPCDPFWWRAGRTLIEWDPETGTTTNLLGAKKTE